MFVDCHTVIVQKWNALEEAARAIKTAITQIAATGGVSGINFAIAKDLIPNPSKTMNEMKKKYRKDEGWNVQKETCKFAPLINLIF